MTSSAVATPFVVTPYRFCNRFHTCSVNRCPLDPSNVSRVALPQDRESNRPISRPGRLRMFDRLPIELKSGHRFGGLYEEEWRRREAARRRYSGLGSLLQARVLGGREKGLAKLREHNWSSPSRLSGSDETLECGRPSKKLNPR